MCYQMYMLYICFGRVEISNDCIYIYMLLNMLYMLLKPQFIVIYIHIHQYMFLHIHPYKIVPVDLCV